MGVPRISPELLTDFRSIPTFRPQGPDAAAHLFSGLADAMNGIVNKAATLTAESVKNDAAIAGAKAGAREGFNAASLPTEGTIAAQAFREGALKSYGAQLELARDEAFNGFQVQYAMTPEDQRNPATLESQMHSWIAGTAQTLPEQMRPAFMQIALAKANPAILSATTDWMKRQQVAQAADQKALIDNLGAQLLANPLPQTDADKAAYATTLAQYGEALRQSGMGSEQIAQAQREMHVKLTQAALLKSFDESPDQMKLIGEMIDTDPAKLGLTTEQHNALVNQMQAHINDKSWYAKQTQEQLTFGQRVSLGVAQNDLEARVSSGAASEKEVLAFAAQNQAYVQPGWVANQLSKIGEVRQKHAQEDSEIRDVMAGNLPANVSDDKKQGIIDRVFSQVTSAPQAPVSGATITSPFGKRVAPTAGASTFHQGTDYAAHEGDPVHSILPGRVIFSGEEKGFGNTVTVQLANGDTATYGHLSALYVKAGDRVDPDTVIGAAGSTGTSTGPHVHEEIRLQGKTPTDPVVYRQQLASQNVADVRHAAEALIAKTGIVPTVYRNEVIALAHGNPQQAAEAATRYAWLEDQGIELKGVSDRDRGYLQRIDQEIKNGVPARQAVEIARFATDPKNKGLLSDSDKAANEALKKNENTLSSAFSSGFGPWSHTTLASLTGNQRAVAEGEWAAAYRKAYFDSGRDEALARKNALAAIKIIYGESAVTGSPVLMRHPPEQVYGLRGYTSQQNAEWMQRQLLQDVGKAVFPAPKANEMVLYSDSQTQKGGGWRVWAKGANGSWGFLHDGNGYLRWKPDPQAEVSRLKVEAARGAGHAMRAARLQRARDAKSSPGEAARLGSLTMGMGAGL